MNTNIHVDTPLHSLNLRNSFHDMLGDTHDGTEWVGTTGIMTHNQRGQINGTRDPRKQAVSVRIPVGCRLVEYLQLTHVFYDAGQNYY